MAELSEIIMAARAGATPNDVYSQMKIKALAMYETFSDDFTTLLAEYAEVDKAGAMCLAEEILTLAR